jgi:uncharacterized protein YjiS (DUF1127 family)
MITRTVTEDQFEIETSAATGSSSLAWAVVAAIPAQFRHARHIERQAKQLYAMSDNELDELGLTRETIPAQLLKAFGE